jgi:type IV secretion system protein VirB10
MNYFKLPLVVLLSICVSGLLAIIPAAAQGTTALERGYRTGYSDGYSAGSSDVSQQAARDYKNKEDYQRADRSYNDVWGPIEDYRDGYQQGFEAGYNAGYERQQFNSSLPAGLHKRGTQGGPVSVDVNVPTPSNQTPSNNDTQSEPDNTVASTGSLVIPRNTILALELLTPVSTDASQRGDRLQARVFEPAQYAGYIVEGRVSQVKRPGKVKGVAELQLAFDQIRSPDNRTAALRAELVEVTPVGGDNTEIDSEGGVKGRDSTKDDAIIGLIAGGGKGAAIGAIIGGGVGTAGVMTQRGKDIRIEHGQHLKIRTSTDTSVL